MFVTTRKRGARGSDAHLPSHSRVCRNGEKLLLPLPCADRGDGQAQHSGGRNAPPCRHPRVANGEASVRRLTRTICSRTPELNRVSDPNLALEFRPRTVVEYRTSRYSTAGQPQINSVRAAV